MHTEAIKGYSAALVDGEGTVRVTRLLSGHRARYVPEVEVYNTDKGVLVFLEKHWGGDIRPKRRAISIHRQGYAWRVRRAEQLGMELKTQGQLSLF